MSETHRVVWFVPDRPVAGTVYVHQNPDETDPDNLSESTVDT